MTEEMSMARVTDAMYRYKVARRHGLLHRALAALRGRSSRPLDLASVAVGSSIHARHSTGIRAVPIRQIRGSEGRGNDFDADFHPVALHTRNRWQRIADGCTLGASFPPVELIRVGDSYFVRDGHHRVSVAAHMGLEEIDAEVTEWQLTQPSPSEPDLPVDSRDERGSADGR